MATSSAVSAGDLATAQQYNDLRTDVLSTHDHDGSDGSATISATSFNGVATVSAAWTYTADVTLNDSVALTLGTGGDVDIEYDGTDLVLNLTVVGSGDFVINNGSVEFDDSEGVTLGTGKDATLQYDGTDVVLNTAAVGSGDLVVNNGSIEFDDAEGIRFGTGKDTEIRWSTADADNHALVLAVGNSNQGLHITDLGAIATDWNIAATTHPNAYIHSNTTPRTDYLRLGDHDGTTAYIDVVGGTTLAFEIDGTTEMSMTASVLNLASGNTYQINGTNVLSNNTLGTGVVTSSLTTVGALNSGSITSGFGAIDNGASNITTTGDITGGGIHVTGDTAAGDNAALGYTSAEGLILTGQGSTSDITIKNDADADVLKVATGTTTITLPGALSVDDATDSTSGTTGSIHTDGGLGVAKNLFVATDARVDGTATLDTVDINAGNIDGTAIGAASASSIVGTTIDATTDFTIGATVITDGVLTDSGGFQIAAALDMNANTISNIGNAGNDFSAHSLNMTAANSGGARSIIVQNTSGDANSEAYIQIFSGGTSAGNAYLRFDISGGITWGMGADNANGNRFALGSDATLGGRDMFRITTDTTPVLTWNTTHPTGTFDYVCDECGRHGPASFSCCGIVAYHPDVPALAPLMDSLRGQPLTGREPGVQHLVDLGIMEVSTNNDGSPWIGMNPIEAQWYTWSGMLQMHRRIKELEAQVEALCR